MVSPVNRPHSSNQGTGHQAGAGEPKSWFGQIDEQDPLDRGDECQKAVGDG